ncbi:MAG: OPA family glycerol-3-phosphate transporter-like MFS transporter [Polyangiales bacterium]|jgi:OPA family glycerol-3-phosphate transporter-like MFS transporter
MKEFLPILILLAVIGVVFLRLPKVDLGHSKKFLRRRVGNWLPLGLTYAFLYMGRYNVTVSQNAFGDILNEGVPLMTNGDFATIFFWGTATYGTSFVINGPLTDRIGGRKAILLGAGGSLIMNAAMGVITMLAVANPASSVAQNLTIIFSVLYAMNMYFQSFGAVAIVKCNAPWFHVRERGVFGAIFGVLISLGVYFAFDWGYKVLENFGLDAVFFVPAAILVVCWVIVFVQVRDTPVLAGFDDFDPEDASSGDDGPQLGAKEVFIKMARNPIIMTIACVEFCSGFLRQAIMQWFRTFAKQTDSVLHLKDSFVYDNWGMLLCCAGILGGVVAGIISDRVFQSRRGPVAAILYAGMGISAVVLAFVYATPVVGWLVVFMSMAVIGVHGMLSGTASMDFGGRKNVGVAVGIIDGFVYAGTAVMSMTYGFLLPDDTNAEFAADPANWISWPVAMIPMALIGFVLATRLWNAKPKKASEEAAEQDKTKPATV